MYMQALMELKGIDERNVEIYSKNIFINKRAFSKCFPNLLIKSRQNIFYTIINYLIF